MSYPNPKLMLILSLTPSLSLSHSTFYRAKGTGGAAFGNLTTYSMSRYITNAPKLPKLNNKQSLYSFAKYIKGTLENYLASTDRVISRNHIPRFHHSEAVREVTSMLEYSIVTSEVRGFFFTGM